MTDQLLVDVWSDIACPWCFIGKRRFEAALARFDGRDDVRVRWRSFQLDPSAPAVAPQANLARRLAEKYGASVAQAQAMIDRVARTALDDGLALRFDLVRHGNTFDAHRLVHLAARQGLGDAVKEALFRAHFVEGLAVGEHATLLRTGAAAGLDEAEVDAMLRSDRYADDVREDQREARARRISGVPFFVIGGEGLSGAQHADALLGALERARGAAPPRGADAGATCRAPGDCT